MIKFKLFCLVMALGISGLNAKVWSQQEKLSLTMNGDLVQLFEKIQKQTGFRFVFNHADVKGYQLKGEVKEKTVSEILDWALANKPLKYEIVNEHVIIYYESAKPAQDSVKMVNIKGTVRDEGGLLLPGVSVMIKGTLVGVATGNDGKFTLNVPVRDTVILVFSFVGMKTLEVKFDPDKTEYNVVMKDEQVALDDVVITGFRQTTRQKATGSVAVLTKENFANKAQPTVDNLLQGQIAGVSVQAISGRPGESAKIRIRGTSTFSGDADPLWVIDGVPLQQTFPNISTTQIKSGDFSTLFLNGIGGVNPNDIENVTVLKDAAAAAIYGSRAAGGVIVVTTKKGKVGKMRVNYAGNVTIVGKPQRDGNLMNSAEKLAWEQELWDEFSAEKYNEGLRYPVVGIVGMLRSGRLGKDGKFKGDNGYEPMSAEEQDAYLRELSGHTTNWFDELFRTTVSTSHHLSLSGGAERSTYYIALGYSKDNGVLKKTDYDRYSFNAKINLMPIDQLKLDFGFDLAQQKSGGSSLNVDPFKYAYFANPYERPYNEDGSYRADVTYHSLPKMNDASSTTLLPPNGFNIMREIDETSSKVNNFSTTLRMGVEYRFIEKLKFAGLASYTFTNNKTDNINGINTYAAYADRFSFDRKNPDRVYGSITQTSGNNSSYFLRGHFMYDDLYGENHRLSVLAGAEIRGTKAKSMYAKRYGYDPVTGNSSIPIPSKPASGDNISYSDLESFAAIVDQLSGENVIENRFASFYASLDYYLMERYIFSFSFRTDGSNHFGSDEQFNPTWSLGAVWHLGDENFMAPLKPVLNRVALRAAFGYTGNVNTSYSPELIMNYDKVNRKFGNGLRMATVYNAPNPNLRWEKTKDMKLALDFGLWNDRISGLVEWYYRLSSDVATDVKVLTTTGFNHQGYNTSEIENKGIEGTLNVKVLDGKDFKLKVSANVAWNQNKLKKYNPPASTYYSYEGFPLSGIFGGRVTGIDPQNGMYLFELRPDAEINQATDLHKGDNYRFYLGTNIAPVTGGFNVNFSYKNVSLNVGGSYSSGAKVINNLASPASYSRVGSSSGDYEPVQSDYNDLYTNHLNVQRDRTNRWTPNRTTGVKYGRIIDSFGDRLYLDYYNPTETVITRGIMLENISYLRIQNISIAYNLGTEVLNKLKLSSMGFMLTMNNFFTITNYSGLDPETPGATYPKTRSVTLGITVGF